MRASLFQIVLALYPVQSKLLLYKFYFIPDTASYIDHVQTIRYCEEVYRSSQITYNYLKLLNTNYRYTTRMTLIEIIGTEYYEKKNCSRYIDVKTIYT